MKKLSVVAKALGITKMTLWNWMYAGKIQFHKIGSMNYIDINAANNILDEGLRDLYQFTSEELSDYKRREAVRPAEVSSPKASSLKRLVHFVEIDRKT